MNDDVRAFNQKQSVLDIKICNLLATTIDQLLREAENKIWHRHPVWFLEGNPIVGYSKLRAGIRLMLWSSASFDEKLLHTGTGIFQDASIMYTSIERINHKDLKNWIAKAKNIQCGYTNIYKRKGVLIRLK